MKKKSRSSTVARLERSVRPQLSGTNLQHAGDHNQRVTLHAVRIHGPVTRAELAARTGLTSSAIAQITNRLLKDRFVSNAARMRGGRGQPAKTFVINPDSCFSVGLNVDRDHVTVIVLDFEGKVRARASREINFAKPAVVRRWFNKAIGPLLTKAGIARRRIIGVGVAVPDDINRTHLPDQPADYAAWTSVSMEALIYDTLRVPVFVENDATAAAIGELHFGSGQRYRSFFYLLVTAALGGGVIADGSYFRGSTGRSGEIGWLQARNEFGESSDLNNVVSLSALYRRLGKRGFRVATPNGLLHLPVKAQRVLERWIKECTDALSEPLAAINCLINPEAIVIGGRLPTPLIDRLVDSLNARMAEPRNHIPAVAIVARAVIAEDAPSVGAAILPFSYQLLPTRFALLKPT